MGVLNVLLDTNVLIDMAVERNDNHETASKIVKSCVVGKLNGYVTSHSLTDFFYIVRKYCDLETRKDWIIFFINNFVILTEEKERFAAAIDDIHFEDLEDQLQMECADFAQLDYIVTENLKDFTKSEVQAVSIKDFAEKIMV